MRVGYPDTMNKKGPSPLKARYTSSGESEDLQAVSIDVKKIGAGIKKLFGG